MGNRPTIKDVAAHAGVSKSTVSLVLQNSSLVRKETRDAVTKSIRALGYVRNRAAATLRGSDTGLIGLVINDLRNPFFTEFATSLQMALSERGLSTVIANCDEDAGLQNKTILTMLEHDVSGFVISPCYGNVDAGFKAIQQSGLPALQVLRQVPTSVPPLPFFSHDYEKGSRLAVQYLLEAGVEKIAFVGGLEGREITLERMSGYLSDMSERNLPITVLYGRPTRAFGRDIAAQILEDYPDIDAAICFNDLVALGLQAGLAERGRRPGVDFSVVGFDDIEEARLSSPPLTTLRCDVSRFGTICAETLNDLIETGAPQFTEKRLTVELIVRKSTVSA